MCDCGLNCCSVLKTTSADPARAPERKLRQSPDTRDANKVLSARPSEQRDGSSTQGWMHSPLVAMEEEGPPLLVGQGWGHG